MHNWNFKYLTFSIALAILSDMENCFIWWKYSLVHLKKKHEFLNEFMFQVINDPDMNTKRVAMYVNANWLDPRFTIKWNYCTDVRDMISARIHIIICMCVFVLPSVWIIIMTINCIVLPKILLCPFTDYV